MKVPRTERNNQKLVKDILEEEKMGNSFFAHGGKRITKL
jgi:hypothetical protein